MKTLYLLRHAKSDWTDFLSSNLTVSDHARPLSKKGLSDCQKISEYFIANRVKLDLVLVSSAVRAQSTFNNLNLDIVGVSKKVDTALYTFNMKKVIGVIQNCDNYNENLLIVGHNPAFHELAIYLSKDNSISSMRGDMVLKFPTGSLVRLDLNIVSWSQISENCGNLIDFVRPKDFKINK